MEVVNLQSIENTSHLLCFEPHIFCGPIGGNCHNYTTEVWHHMQCNYGVLVDIPTQHRLEENQQEKWQNITNKYGI